MNLTSYNTVRKIFFKVFDITANEYLLADTIYHLEHGKKSAVPGWCYASKASLADDLNISNQAVFSLIKKLEKKGLVERNEETKFLRTTEKWAQVYDPERIQYFRGELEKNKVDNVSRKLTPTIKKVDSEVSRKLIVGYQESLYNNNIDSNTDNNIDNNSCRAEAQREILKADVTIEIIEHLNKKAGRKFQARGKSGKSNRRKVAAQLKKGFSPAQLKAMIDFKVADWRDLRMKRYLRPDTLFGEKCPTYVEESQTLKQTNHGKQNNQNGHKGKRTIIDPAVARKILDNVDQFDY